MPTPSVKPSPKYVNTNEDVTTNETVVFAEGKTPNFAREYTLAGRHTKNYYLFYHLAGGGVEKAGKCHSQAVGKTPDTILQEAAKECSPRVLKKSQSGQARAPNKCLHRQTDRHAAKRDRQPEARLTRGRPGTQTGPQAVNSIKCTRSLLFQIEYERTSTKNETKRRSFRK